MTNVFHIFRRELRVCFASPLAYVVLVVFVAVTNFLFFFYNPFFLIGEADVRALFDVLPWLLLLLVPAITMRLWAEERRQGTMEFLLTMPVRDGEVVAAKFLASLAFLIVAIALTLPIPLTVNALAEGGRGVDSGPIVGGYAGAVLLGASYLTIGMCASYLTSSQIIAYILGVVVCFALLIIGQPVLTVNVAPGLAPVLSYLGLGAHYERLLRGILDARDVVYYVSVIAFFLYVNARLLESRSYR